MGLMQEGLRRPGETGKKINRLPIAEAGLGVKIREISRMFSVQKGKETGKPQPQTTGRNGFEPFVNPKPSEDTLFVNGYNGNFAQKMKLNEILVKKVLGISHLEGQIFLTSLSFSPQRSMDTAKKKLMLGEEIDDSQKEINPSYRTVPIKEGWRIEINDGKILEDLNEKGLTGERLQKTFIKKFSQLLNTSLFECIRKEKMTGIKDENFGRKFFISVFTPAIGLFVFAPKLLQLDLPSIAVSTSTYFAVNVFINLFDLLSLRPIESHDTNSSAYVRKLDARWEYLMPQVEVDKVLRSFFSLKARTLVKEKKPEIK